VSHPKRAVFLIAGGLVFALLVTYAGLSAYKAVQYTTTPRQIVSRETPADFGLPYEEITFPSAADGALTLRGWWIPNPASRRTIILVHGRYENRTAHDALMRPLWEHGYNVLLFDLRGHGASDPASCTYGLREQWDIIGAVNVAKAKGIPSGSIGVIGWSLGAASAIMAMRQTDDITAVVSDSAYANSDPLLARNPLRPGLALAMRLVRGVNLARVKPEEAIAHLGTRHVFLIHGAQDQVVPVAQAYRLQAAGGANVSETWIVPGANHTQAYPNQPADYLLRITAFFDTELR
jgi:dipeptidyl aminopeptidase/acylaminoacyl peptidase